jgi:DNA recombination protein RmuC
VIDAKVPLAAYLDAIEARDEDTRKVHITAHVRQMRDHVKKLSAKSYWDQVDGSADFVVMFVDEAIYRVALEEDPSLMEDAFSQQVMITTPTSLLALLHAVNYGWRQERMAESAKELSALGHELHSRLGKFGDMLAKVGRSLGTSVNAYNEAVGSFDSRVLVSARKLADAGAASDSKELPAPAPIELAPRAVRALELDEDDDQEIRIRRLPAA